MCPRPETENQMLETVIMLENQQIKMLYKCNWQ